MPSSVIKRLADRIRLRSLEKRKVAHKHDWDGYRRVLDEFTPSTIPHKIYLNQIWPEWKQFVEFLVRERSPKRILEIGTGRAGSTYFLTNVGGEGSLLVTVDTEPIAKEFVDLYRRYPKQRVINLIGNSRDPITVERVAGILKEEPLDLLYIDGDHSYDGVKMDFELYQRFCDPQTVICFHDIIPDHGVTKGIQTDNYSGEVYRLWDELKTKKKYKEFVDSADQNGFGIGVILPEN
jgi:predicted O-methyltransferase YrrM